MARSVSPNSPMLSFSRRGFTLIELLTVVAIIGILAAILIPTVGAVRKRAATANDMSNLRQIGNGIQMHVNDNKGLLPNQYTPIPGTATTSGGLDRWSFHEAVDRYFGKGPQFNRTSIYNWLSRGNMWYSKYAQIYPSFTPPTGYLMTQPLAYSYNGNVHNSKWGAQLSRVPAPSRTVIMAEVCTASGSGITYTQAPVTTDATETLYRVNREGKALYLFCDGRVALLSGDQSEPALIARGQPSIWRWW